MPGYGYQPSPHSATHGGGYGQSPAPAQTTSPYPSQDGRHSFSSQHDPRFQNTVDSRQSFHANQHRQGSVDGRGSFSSPGPYGPPHPSQSPQHPSAIPYQQQPDVQPYPQVPSQPPHAQGGYTHHVPPNGMQQHDQARTSQYAPRYDPYGASRPPDDGYGQQAQQAQQQHQQHQQQQQQPEVYRAPSPSPVAMNPGRTPSPHPNVPPDNLPPTGQWSTTGQPVLFCESSLVRDNVPHDR